MVIFNSGGKGTRTQPTAWHAKPKFTHGPTSQDKSTGVETGAPGLELGCRSESTEPEQECKVRNTGVQGKNRSLAGGRGFSMHL